MIRRAYSKWFWLIMNIFHYMPNASPTLFTSGHHQFVCNFFMIICVAQIYEYFLFGKLFLIKK